MMLCINKDYKKTIKKEPEQDFYECWKRVASEIKKNETSRNEEFDDNDDLRDEWNEFDR